MPSIGSYIPLLSRCCGDVEHTRMETSELKRFLRDIIAEAGRISLAYRARLDGLVVHHKLEKDLVTEADVAVEQFLVDAIRKRYPDHAILGEEGGEQQGVAFRWVIDPIDGTTSFIHGHPFYSVSIAVEHDGRTILAAVNAPVLDELFEAQMGSGATLNGKPVRVSRRSSLADSVLATGFACIRRGSAETNLPYFNRLLPAIRDVRRHGSAAVDLGYVACGRLEGFWELDLKIYDVAAGFLILTEAGGRYSDFGGGTANLYDQILATNGLIHEQVMDIFGQVAGR